MFRRSASAEDVMKHCGSSCSSGGLWGAPPWSAERMRTSCAWGQLMPCSALPPCAEHTTAWLSSWVAAISVLHQQKMCPGSVAGPFYVSVC
jgi:hypothetical protein